MNRIETIVDRCLLEGKMISENIFTSENSVRVFTLSETDEAVCAEIIYKNRITPEKMGYCCERLADINSSLYCEHFAVGEDGTIISRMEFSRKGNINNMISAVRRMLRESYRFVFTGSD